MSVSYEFDAIVIGSGITGGWAAKELTEGGLKTLMIERGRSIEHGKDYTTEFQEPWQSPFRGMADKRMLARDYPIQSQGPMNEFSYHFWVNDRKEPYQTPTEKPFNWFRGYQLGGRSLLWTRQSLRLGPSNFENNLKDGHGVDWPIRYRDLAAWYDHVEAFIGVSGQAEGAAQVPDGQFTPAMPLNCVEQHVKSVVEKKWPGRVITPGRTANLTARRPGRDLCKFRNQCDRGCSWGGYFSTLSSTLPAAKATGLLEVLSDSRAVKIEYDDTAKRATGVVVFDEKTRKLRLYRCRIIFLCASTFNSVQILLNSATQRWPDGLANSSGVLGRYIMDHNFGGSASAVMPGFADKFETGRRPTYSLILPFRNTDADTSEVDFVRSYYVAMGATRPSWHRGLSTPGIGGDFKDGLARPGPWVASMHISGEVLPYEHNRVELDPKHLDAAGVPQLKIHLAFGENERRMSSDGEQQCRAMLVAAGGRIIKSSSKTGTPGAAIHEMGGARMGRDPRTSVLNANNQCHDVPNVFVTDGACMTSSAAQNPSLTYMALTARAANYAIGRIKAGAL